MSDRIAVTGTNEVWKWIVIKKTESIFLPYSNSQWYSYKWKREETEWRTCGRAASCDISTDCDVSQHVTASTWYESQSNMHVWQKDSPL